MEDKAARAIREALESAPKIPGVDWSMALAVYMLRELDARSPGFMPAIRDRVREAHDRFAASADPSERADAPSLHDLAESWVFQPIHTAASARAPEEF